MTGLPRVLFVDDEPRVLEAFELELFDEFEVTTAPSGAAGLDLIERSAPFPVVVSDMRMPHMDGATFLAAVRELSPHTVRILLTGHADLDAVIAAVNAGHIFRYLQKPCPRSDLVAALAAAVAEHRRRVAEVEQAESAMRETRRLIDTLSHELNTPLAAVQGLAQALAEHDGTLSGPEQAELLAIIAEQSADLTATIRDLMVVGRSAIGGLAVRPDLVDVLDLLHAAADAAPGPVTVEGRHTTVCADSERLRQAVDILIGNAFSHGSDPVVVSVVELAHGVSVAVRDRGPGVPDELTRTMFDPFVTGTGDRPGKATAGLGLAVVRGLAEAMGGSVGYHRLGGWTVFELVLPAAPNPF